MNTNPYWPYWLTNTVHFVYNNKNVIGTILKFGNGYVTMITKDGYRNYNWNKMVVTRLYECSVRDLAMAYTREKNEDYAYLAKHYGYCS